MIFQGFRTSFLKKKIQVEFRVPILTLVVFAAAAAAAAAAAGESTLASFLVGN